MRAFMIVAAAAAVCQSPAQSASPCARSVGDRAIAYVEVRAPRPGDTVATAFVCAMPAKGAAKIASYNGELTFDSLAARLVSFAHPPDGLRATNERVRGTIAFAGAAPSGFAGSEIATAQLRLVVPGRLPPLALRIRELNDTAGTNLLASVRVESYPAAAATPCDEHAPRITSIVPAEVNISAGDQTPLEIRGCGFSPTNSLRIGPVTFSGVASTDGGTRIAFVVPLTIPATGEAPPRQMPTGVMEVVVSTSSASTNRAELRLK